MKLICRTFCILCCLTLTQCAAPKKSTYACSAFQDSHYNSAPQKIPGRIQNEYYDHLILLNGKKITDEDRAKGIEEGLCYHDDDNNNSGSGALNKTGSYEKEFRMFESPDISYIKLHNPDVAVDDTPFNRVAPQNLSLYLGWISPGEWVNYTVEVTQSGYYSLSTMYTSKFGGHIALEVDGKNISGNLPIESTYDANDPIEWRQAHHWNKTPKLGHFYLHKGIQVIRLKFLDQPVMNFDYMDFERAD